MTPKDVADYARRDSLALKEVDLPDILDELRIRGTETCKLYRTEVITELEKLVKQLKESYEVTIGA